MRARSVKLREAHKINNGIPSFCSILWDKGAHHILTASSSDNVIFVYDSNLLSSTSPAAAAAPKLLRHHRDGVTAIAISPNSTCLASGSVDHSVKLYKFPNGEFETNITRFTLPIRTLAFNKSGSVLAAAGDDEGIKLINTIDGTIARVLKGHKGSVTCLAFDPRNNYLASIDTKGTVILWELESGTILYTLKGVAPETGSDGSIVNAVSWSPDGELLAVPGRKRDVVMYERDTAEKLFTLRGDHEQSVCFISWSPNGKYLATSSLDRQVIIWDVEQRQDIDRQKFDERICYMMWKLNGNALAVIDVMAKFGLWEPVIPSSMKSPTEDVPNSHPNNSNERLKFDEEEEPCTSASLTDLVEDHHGGFGALTRKRLRKHALLDENPDEDLNEELTPSSPLGSRKKPSHSHKIKLELGVVEQKTGLSCANVKMQDAFQPGATPIQPGMRSFLCYNMLGCITTFEQDGCSRIEIDFHDTSQGPRVPSMTDYFGFSMAAMDENGSVFANPCKGNKNLSTLMYRPFRSWANNSEWSMRFEGEEVKAVALGNGWVAAVTSLNFLRIFTEGGLQKHIVSLDGPVVTAVGYRDELALVTHASAALPNNDQMLEFKVFNIANGTQPVKGKLPISPASTLVWFGFSEEGQLSSFDSKGVLRVYLQQYGGSWFPIFRACKQRSSSENYWVVGLSAEKLFCVVCKSPDLYPKVAPKPVLTLLDLSVPLASSDLGADSLESEFILKNMHLAETQKRINDMVAAGQDSTRLDDEAFDMEAALDRCILKLIASCCNGDKLVRATELIKLLTLEKSMRGAIKIVTALKLPSLAERFSSILEERLLLESTRGSTPVPNQNSKLFNIPYQSSKILGPSDPLTSSRPVTDSEQTMKCSDTRALAEGNKSSEPPNTPVPSQLTAPLFRKKARVQNGPSCQAEKEQNGSVGQTVEGNKGVLRAYGSEKLKCNADMMNRGSSSHQQFANPSSYDKDVRPTNPFAKASKNEERTSLFNSIHKMKVDGSQS